MVQKAVGATGLEIRQAPIGLAFRFKGVPSRLEGGKGIRAIDVFRDLQGGPEKAKIEGLV